ISSTFDIRHFIYALRHEPRTRAPAHLEESSAYGPLNPELAAVCDHSACLAPPLRCTGRIDRLSATERKSRCDNLETRARSLSKKKMTRPRQSSRHAGLS